MEISNGFGSDLLSSVHIAACFPYLHYTNYRQTERQIGKVEVT